MRTYCSRRQPSIAALLRSLHLVLLPIALLQPEPDGVPADINVIDSGVLVSHEDLDGRASPGADLVDLCG